MQHERNLTRVINKKKYFLSNYTLLENHTRKKTVVAETGNKLREVSPTNVTVLTKERYRGKMHPSRE